MDGRADSAGDSGTVVDELEKEIAQLQARERLPEISAGWKPL